MRIFFNKYSQSFESVDFASVDSIHRILKTGFSHSQLQFPNRRFPTAWLTILFWIPGWLNLPKRKADCRSKSCTQIFNCSRVAAPSLLCYSRVSCTLHRTQTSSVPKSFLKWKRHFRTRLRCYWLRWLEGILFTNDFVSELKFNAIKFVFSLPISSLPPAHQQEVEKVK